MEIKKLDNIESIKLEFSCASCGNVLFVSELVEKDYFLVYSCCGENIVIRVEKKEKEWDGFIRGNIIYRRG